MIKTDAMNLKMNYPKDTKELDEFYKEWYALNKDKLEETWNRPDVYDFASKYANKRLILSSVVKSLPTDKEIDQAAFESVYGYSSTNHDSFKEGVKWAIEQLTQ